MHALRSALATVLLLALAGSPARGDALDDKLAKGHFSTGHDYYNAGRYEPAVKEFLEAYRLSKRVDLLYNIALCYEKLGEPGRVTTYLRKYLAARPDAKERPQIETQLASLEARVATLTLRTSIPGAEFYVDGELAGVAPLDPLVLTAGKHALEARFRDHAPVSREVDLVAGQGSELSLEPPAPPVVEPPPVTEPPVVAPAAPSPPIVEATPAPAPATAVPAAALTTPPAPPPRRKTWIWGVVGGAGGAVVLAVVLGVAFGTGGTNHAANARAGCMGSDCTLIDLKGLTTWGGR